MVFDGMIFVRWSVVKSRYNLIVTCERSPDTMVGFNVIDYQ